MIVSKFNFCSMIQKIKNLEYNYKELEYKLS